MANHEFIYGRVLVTSDARRTIPVGVLTSLVVGDLYFWGPLMAAALIGSVPVAVLYGFSVEQYAAGLYHESYAATVKLCYDYQNYAGVYNPLGLCKFLIKGQVGPERLCAIVNRSGGPMVFLRKNARHGWGLDKTKDQPEEKREHPGRRNADRCAAQSKKAVLREESFVPFG